MQHPERWLAVLRIAVGAWFIKSIWTKWVLLGGVLPVPMASERWIDTLPKIMSGYVATNPLSWYAGFLQDVVIPNSALFAHLTAVGEGLVGIGLTFGLFTRFSAASGLFLLLAYELGALGKPFQQHGLRLFMIVMMLAFFFTYAGKVWGLDGKLERRRGLSSL
jgi:thiosulfate dehydrogenase [quinone] large subunit